MIMTNPTGIKVKPWRITQIRNIAQNVRELFNVSDPFIDIIDIYENKLPHFGIVVDILTQEELGNDHGLTIPDQGIIYIREDVYIGAHQGKGRDRFTCCHELGHLFLHAGISFARSQMPANDHRWIEDSEWQANTFAAEIMMPVPFVQRLCSCCFDLQNTFGVSFDAANTRWTKLGEQGLIK